MHSNALHTVNTKKNWRGEIRREKVVGSFLAGSWMFHPFPAPTTKCQRYSGWEIKPQAQHCAKVLTRMLSCLVVSNSLWPHGLWPTRLLYHGISQARILERVAISFSRGSSQPWDWTHVSCIDRYILLLLNHLGSPLVLTHHLKTISYWPSTWGYMFLG